MDFNQVMSGTNNQADWTLYTDWVNTQSAERIHRHSTRNLDPITYKFRNFSTQIKILIALETNANLSLSTIKT